LRTSIPSLEIHPYSRYPAVVALPLVLIVLAAAAAGMLAYGTDPTWGQFDHGIDLIVWSRRLQWPLIATAILLCLALLFTVISGKRRVWWLIALLPILALFAHRFLTGPMRTSTIAEDPAFTPAAQADFLADDDYVVGVHFADSAYAFPYSVLFNAPVVIKTDRDRRMILIWSPFANRAMVCSISRELRGRDLEIVSSPANSLLLYNSKLGQFINGVTGLTATGDRPTGFHEQIIAVKEPWRIWRAQNPDSQVMVPMQMNWRTAPRQPVLPFYAMPKSRGEFSDQRLVTVVATTQPIAVPSSAYADSALNLTAGPTPVVLFRQPKDQSPRAFDRQVDDDLTCRFAPLIDPKHADAALIDQDTATEWSSAGAAIVGPKETHGKKLSPIVVEDDLYWGVMKFWYPELRLVNEAELHAAAAAPQNLSTPADASNQTPTATKPKRLRRKPAG
jgi:Protein of unknown function (DUF3179)